ncbi:hypothetical protein CCR79_08270 [Halorhodospira halophila]|nr:hypothetical protein [Halorhodospira halophila]
MGLLSHVAHAETVSVGDSDELETALREAQPGETIELRPGDYVLPSLTLRTDGEADAPITVQSVIPGKARIWSDHTTLMKLYGAHWHFRGLDFQGSRSANHAFHIVRGADDVVLEGNRFQNFHAAIKANGEGSPPSFPDRVRIHRNVFNNETARDTNQPVAAINVNGGRDWVITENFISDIGYAAERHGVSTSTAFVKGGAYGATFDRNVVICEWRHTGGYRAGMSFGGGGTGERYFDRRGMEHCRENCPEVRNSRMTNNIILNCPNHAGIYLNQAHDVLISNNTVYDAFGVIAQFPHTAARVQDNLMTGRVWTRRDAQVDTAGNLTSGWPGPWGYLPSVRSRLHAPEPGQEGSNSDGIEAALDWAVARTRDAVDWLGASRLGKGLNRYEDWLTAPAFGQLQPRDPEAILGRGHGDAGVDHDFCGQPREGAVDVGAIQYTAGDCTLQRELPRRHGELFAGLSQGDQRHPETPAAAQRDMAAPLDLPAPTRTLSATPESFSEKVAELRPGDALELEPGTYSGGLDLRGLEGTEERPIVIRGPERGEGQETAVLLGESGRNTVRFEDSAHIVLKNLELDGRGRNVSAVVAEATGDYAHDITLDGLSIHGYDGIRGNSGITTRSTAWNWVIRNSEIRRVGTGMYLGQPDGAPFIAGVIEGNQIAETLGYGMQIKHQDERTMVPGMPTDPQRTVIRGNTFDKAEGGERGSGARPNLLVGHFPTFGPGQHDQYLIHGNLFFENPHQRLFQGEGNVALYNNLFVNRHGVSGLGGDGAIFLRHNDVPKDLYVLNNTFVTEGFGLRIAEPDTDYEQIVQGNAIFSAEPLSLDGIEAPDNFTADLPAAWDKLVRADGSLEQLDLTPRAGALERDTELSWPKELPGLDRDYHGAQRSQSVWGALQARE